MITEEGLGSGVLISEEGDILTAAHVVHTAENIVVTFSDGTKASAKVIGSVVGADLAHIRLDWMPEGRTICSLGDSDSANIGDQVIVIGAPYGIERSLSVGHISGKHLEDKISEGFDRMELIQTDAAINRGNSGGPMFNLKGEVIGIVSHILSESGGFEGIGFVISSNLAKTLFIEQKAFWSGFESILIEGKMAETFNLPQKKGLLVQRVVSHSPAHNMGLRGGKTMAIIDDDEVLLGGDIILDVNGISLDDEIAALKIREKLLSLKKGDTVTLKVLRAGKTINLTSKDFIIQ
ncbi:MAG: trypsin-like peptidase domain-containing protein [Bacteroidales bacterium]